MVNQREHRAQPEAPGDAGMDDEDRIERQEKPDQQAVEEGFMVGDDQQAGGRLQMLQTFDADAEKQVEHQAESGFQSGFQHDGRTHGGMECRASCPCRDYMSRHFDM